jgi:hypothetical protein
LGNSRNCVFSRSKSTGLVMNCAAPYSWATRRADYGLTSLSMIVGLSECYGLLSMNGGLAVRILSMNVGSRNPMLSVLRDDKRPLGRDCKNS